MKKNVNFDEVINRCGTGSRKWDNAAAVFGAQDVLPMWIADMDFTAPPAVVEALKSKVEQQVYGYYIRDEAVYQAAASWLERRHGWEAAHEWVINANGVVSSINIAILALTAPGDQIIIQPPIYPPFFSSVSKNGREIVENPLKYENGNYYFDFADLEKKLTPRVKMLLLSSPHNPVGRVWTKDELQQLGEICLRHNVIIISDEIHGDLVFQGHKHIPLATLSPELAKQTITCISPSKTFNLAGLYTSFMVIPDREKRREISILLEKLDISRSNLFGLAAAQAAYESGDDWLDALLVYLEGNADFLVQYITANIPEVRVSKPEGTYLAWLDFRGLFNAADVQPFLIQQAKVGLNDGSTFGKQGEGFARLNFGCPRALLQEGLDRIARAMRGRQEAK